ncbi:hypothetical protein PAHAL_6G008800 [Panicum hallii]|uniref:At1g61320/AtMIF1 LRR domain-containing protein n=1 Tax=Panicum hallii TaxID=206008 RepID=A0A2T8IEP5_9POAL|nr:hypothetical protein PAHAL_6G008800 [Panicum hallii]
MGMQCEQTLDRNGDGDSRHEETWIPYLPEDIWRHIHSLMPMDAAARAACLSRTFLNSWRCYPRLDLDPGTLCSKKTDERHFRCRVDSILRNHSGIGLKILKLNLWLRKSYFPYLDSWLQAAVTPGIEELTLWLCEEYNFPCSVLSDGVRDSVRSLQLIFCTFRPKSELGLLRSLTRLSLCYVRITGEELECLLSNSLALEHLDIDRCKEIVLLKIPSVLQQLSYLEVRGLENLQVVENNAPNLSRFFLGGVEKVKKLSLGGQKTMKVFTLCRRNAVSYALAELPSIMPNLESLYLCSTSEVHTPPMLPTKFLNLKYLFIQICGGTISQPYDYFSLVHQDRREHESVFGGGSALHLRQLPEHLKLKSVEITGFRSAKTLVELTCCIVKSAVSLERLTLSTFDGYGRCLGENNRDCRDFMCGPISKAELEEASRTLDDHMLSPDAQEKLVREYPPDGIFKIKGGDHCPFFSKPQSLNKILLEIAQIQAPAALLPGKASSEEPVAEES